MLFLQMSNWRSNVAIAIRGRGLIDLGGRQAVVVEPVFLEVGGIQGAQFHPILPDLGHLEAVAPICALVDY